MGADDAEGFPDDGEGPVRRVALRPFAIDVAAVTNAQFEEFVAASGYRTDAERYGWSFVFNQFLPEDAPADARAGLAAVVAAGLRRGLAAPGGPRLAPRGPHGPSGGACLLAGRDGLLRVGGRAPAERGGVGVRGARGPRGPSLPLGRRAAARRRAALQHLAGRVSGAQHGGRRLPGNRARARLRAERLRPLQHRGQRLGVVRGLVQPGLPPAQRRRRRRGREPPPVRPRARRA